MLLPRWKWKQCWLLARIGKDHSRSSSSFSFIFPEYWLAEHGFYLPEPFPWFDWCEFYLRRLRLVGREKDSMFFFLMLFALPGNWRGLPWCSRPLRLPKYRYPFWSATACQATYLSKLFSYAHAISIHLYFEQEDLRGISWKWIALARFPIQFTQALLPSSPKVLVVLPLFVHS